MFEQEQKQEQPQVENVPAQNQINYPSNKLLFGFLPFNNTIKKIFIAIIVLVVLTGLYWLIAESGISFSRSSPKPEYTAPDINLDVDENPGAIGLPSNLDLLGEEEGSDDLFGVDIEYLSFFDFYAVPEENYDLEARSYELPLNTKVDTINYYDVARKINLDSIIEDLNSQGFALLDNPIVEDANDFYSVYNWLEQKDVPVVITTDFLMYYYQQNLKKVFKEIEENIFYNNLWEIHKELYEVSRARYENHLREIGNVNDPILEGERLALAYLGVSLELLKPAPDQINRNLDINDQSKFTEQETSIFNFVLPYYLRDDVVQEVKLIREHELLTKSPVMLYQRNYKDFIVPQEYRENSRLNNFYLTGKWLNVVFPLFYLGESCPDCLLDKDDWRVNMIAAQLLVQDFASSERIKNRWARIYKVMAFFKGLRKDLSYVNYRDAAAAAFGDDYSIAELFASDNLEADNNFAALQGKILEYDYPSIRGGYDLSDPDSNAYQGLKILADFYWPNDYIFSNLISPNTGLRLTDTNEPLTGCRLDQLHQRCLGYSMDVINLFHAPGNDYGDWAENTAYENYDSQVLKLKKQLDPPAWQENNYWSNLNILNSLFIQPPATLPAFAKQASWENKHLNTAVASWINVQLPADKLGLSGIYGQEKVGGLESFGSINYYNYIEPNIYFFDELINTTAMLEDTLAALKVSDGVSSVGLILQGMKHDLEGLKNISMKQISGEQIDELEHQLIYDFSHKYIVIEEGDKGMIAFEGAGKKKLEEKINGVKLLALIRNFQDRPVLVIGPVFDYEEYR